MISREEIKDPKRRILTACVKMFIEKGYKQTTMTDIVKEADVSPGTFQNAFRTKDGVLYTLAEFMFDNQFAIAGSATANADGALVYAIETSIQLAMAELNENLREIYIEAYTQPRLAEYIYQKTSTELKKFFGEYNPTWQDGDFYETDIATAGIMRAYTVHRCDKYFTLKRKTEKFLRTAFDIYHVPKGKQDFVIERISSVDMAEKAQSVMEKLFKSLEMKFDFKFSKGDSI